jgi:hypothetical protein
VRVAVAVLGQQADRFEQLADPLAGLGLRVPWIRIGSPMMSRTGMRGLSDAYGSWNTICRSRRSSRSRLRGAAVTSSPEADHPPRGRLDRRSSVRPSVDLPQPDSPTTPSVSRSVQLEADPVDRVDLADLAAEDTRPGSGSA